MENEHKCVDMKIFMIVREKLIAYKNVKGSCDVYGINNPMLGDNYMINSIVKVSKNT